MYNQTVSFIASVVTLGFMVASYLFKNKKLYLLFQTIGLAFMFVSYLFIEQYFAMIALAVSTTRTLTFFVYESRDKKAPISLAFVFASAAILAYIAVNVIILKTATSIDIFYLIAQVGYAFVFRIRNIKTVRYTVIIPHFFAILYNILLGNAPFVAISYGFELGVDLYVILRDCFFGKKNSDVKTAV